MRICIFEMSETSKTLVRHECHKHIADTKNVLN